MWHTNRIQQFGQFCLKYRETTRDARHLVYILCFVPVPPYMAEAIDASTNRVLLRVGSGYTKVAAVTSSSCCKSARATEPSPFVCRVKWNSKAGKSQLHGMLTCNVGLGVWPYAAKICKEARDSTAQTIPFHKVHACLSNNDKIHYKKKDDHRGIWRCKQH